MYLTLRADTKFILYVFQVLSRLMWLAITIWDRAVLNSHRNVLSYCKKWEEVLISSVYSFCSL